MAIRFGRETCGVLDAALRREWLVTNGLGGYASGTVGGAATRRYHGLLVAALNPPVDRTVLVGALAEAATYGEVPGQRYDLSTHEWWRADGAPVVDPHGYRHLESFELDGTLPIWRFALGDALLERRVVMAYGHNTTYVVYRLLRGSGAVSLEVRPLVTDRDFHSLAHGGGPAAVLPLPGGAAVRAHEGARPFYLLAERADYRPDGDWYWNFWHREEAARGLDDHGDLYAAGTFAVSLGPGASWTLTLSTEADAPPDGMAALGRERERQQALLRQARALDAEPAVRQLVLAADQFLVRRAAPASPAATALPPAAVLSPTNAEGSAPASGAAAPPTDGDLDVPGTGGLAVEVPRAAALEWTVIAGYHWFNDWGRDTMIALPGLALAAGRYAEAAGILRAFGGFVRDGLLPNNFPDRPGVDPGYNTVDAALWYALAVRAYHIATGDRALVEALLPVLRRIVDAYTRGTRYGIGVDPTDGLLRAGEPGVQLTWMDVKIGDWVVTPRIGKPVEINALWYNVLRTLAELLVEVDPEASADYALRAAVVRGSFRARFTVADACHLADVVDGPNGDERELRPNCIFAVSLPYPLIEGAAARGVVEAVGRALLTSYGLRSLDPADPAYRGTYTGNSFARDSIYHQGTVWAWLLGAFVEAHLRVHGDPAAARDLLRPLDDHLRDAGLGTISEIFDGDPPHTPRGCIAQAWSVAEALRLRRRLAAEPVPASAEQHATVC